MRRQCYLIRLAENPVVHNGKPALHHGKPVMYRLFSHVNKSDDPARIKRRNARKKAEAAYIAKLIKEQAA